MKARNVTQADIEQIVTRLNHEKYKQNLVIERIGHESGTTVSFKLGTRDSKAFGSRRSWSGRHGRWACTHVFEDVMREVVRAGGYVPIAKGMPGNMTGTTIRLGTEREVTDWAEYYNNSNIGSVMSPAYAEDMCVNCD